MKQGLLQRDRNTAKHIVSKYFKIFNHPELPSEIRAINILVEILSTLFIHKDRRKMMV
jgi:hypothetical protein